MIAARSRADAELARARTLFQRALAGWACDALRLRRAGLDTPSARPGDWGSASYRAQRHATRTAFTALSLRRAG